MSDTVGRITGFPEPGIVIRGKPLKEILSFPPVAKAIQQAVQAEREQCMKENCKECRAGSRPMREGRDLPGYVSGASSVGTWWHRGTRCFVSATHERLYQAGLREGKE